MGPSDSTKAGRFELPTPRTASWAV